MMIVISGSDHSLMCRSDQLSPDETEIENERNVVPDVVIDETCIDLSLLCLLVIICC